ncbi:transcriptional repressor [Niabella sp.]|uniref:Fur family transcriptional regulator n=1 Tax=Niabella sp. TaxID=1962976 RepID=UPI00263634EF|nr:transcriptional repressor [Niabella sp.]
MDSIVQILKQNNLSVTDGRRKILSLFLNSNGALAHADIEKNTHSHFDRVTVYRTLQSFVDKGIIHTIPTSDNSIKYALCKDECGEGHHHDHHVHLVCTHCGNTFCLDNVVTPSIKLPKDYIMQQVEVVVKGVCKSCNNK